MCDAFQHGFDSASRFFRDRMLTAVTVETCYDTSLPLTRDDGLPRFVEMSLTRDNGLPRFVEMALTRDNGLPRFVEMALKNGKRSIR